MTQPPEEDLQPVEPDPATSPPSPSPSSRRGWGRRGGAVAGGLVVALVLCALAGAAGAAGYERLRSDRRGEVPGALDSVDAVARKVTPSVVEVYAVLPDGRYGTGSGSILTRDGEIVTNNHVVEVVDTKDASLVVRYADDSTSMATLVGRDPRTDLAVIKASHAPHLTPIEVGRSDRLEAGQTVIAVGAPNGLTSTVTAGIVSALHRAVWITPEHHPKQRVVHDTVQDDAAFNPGGSGGALVDMAGRLVGITSYGELVTAAQQRKVAPEEPFNVGINFAIPIDDAMPIIDQLRRGDTPTHAYLGVGGSEDYFSSRVADGVVLMDVSTGSAAARAGLQVGDVIVSVGGIDVTTVETLAGAIGSLRPGDSTRVVYQRSGFRKTVSVSLGSDAGISSASLAQTM